MDGGAYLDASSMDGSSQAGCLSHSNLYCRGLPAECDEALLSQLFSRFGTVQSVRVFRSNQHPSKSPFCFVKLDSAEEAEAAIQSLNGFNLGGNIIEVRLADKDAGATTSDRRPPPSDNIYCKNLPYGFGDNELRQLFSPFGTVTMCRVLHQGDTTGQGGAALVRLSSMDDATRAVQALQGHRVLGALHPLIIRFADSAEIKAKKQAKQMPGAGVGPASAFGRGPGVNTGAPGLPMQQQQPRYNPYGLPSSAPFGPLASPAQQSYVGQGPSGMGGYYGAASVGGAPSSMGGLPMSMPPPQPDPALYMTPSDYALRPGLTGANAPVSAMAVASLYVKNLPPYADKLFLYEKFAPFGAILSVKILTNEEGASRGVGFVNFADTVCASKAVAALHNLPVGDRNLHVTFQTHHKN